MAAVWAAGPEPMTWKHVSRSRWGCWQSARRRGERTHWGPGCECSSCWRWDCAGRRKSATGAWGLRWRGPRRTGLLRWSGGDAWNIWKTAWRLSGARLSRGEAIATWETVVRGRRCCLWRGCLAGRNRDAGQDQVDIVYAIRSGDDCGTLGGPRGLLAAVRDLSKRRGKSGSRNPAGQQEVSICSRSQTPPCSQCQAAGCSLPGYLGRLPPDTSAGYRMRDEGTFQGDLVCMRSRVPEDA